MNEKAIGKLLAYLGSKVTAKQDRPGWVIASCPFGPWNHDSGVDKHPSFGVCVDGAKKGRYHCFSCNESGALKDLPATIHSLNKPKLFAKHATQVEGINVSAALNILNNSDQLDELDALPGWQETDDAKLKALEMDEPWPAWWLDSFAPVAECPEAMHYLTKTRSQPTDPELCEFLDLRYDSERRRVCFPIRDWKGALRGLHGRTIDPQGEPRYYAYGFKGKRNPQYWLGEHWLDLEKPILVVESVFDLASVLRVYRNSTCALFAGLSKEKVLRLSAARHLVTLFDAGKGGDSARKAMAKYLPKVPMEQLAPDAEDKDPGEMSVERILEYLDGTELAYLLESG
jgi:hypothetical protein